MNDDKFPQWLNNIILKRTPDILKVLLEIVEVGLKVGHVSANDTHHLKVSHPNAVGAAFKLIKSLGFAGRTVIPSTKPGSHGSIIFSYTLVERAKAEAFVGRCRTHLLGIPQPREEKPFLKNF